MFSYQKVSEKKHGNGERDNNGEDWRSIEVI